jgi:hypothetical protein
MNSFYEHHKHNIQWHYRCFDRILLNGVIQPFQRPERVVGFFNTYRQLYPVTRQTLRGIAEQFQRWVSERAAMRKIPVIEAPKGRRDDFVDPYFERAKPDQVVVILKAREPARIMIAIGDKIANRWHLQIADRWVTQYNFYINDKVWGRIFVRICPYLPFSARVCLNQHHWLANRMRQQGIAFNQLGNAFLKCSAPDRLQKLADSLAPRDLVTCGPKNGWLTSRRSSPQVNDSMPAASIGCSSLKSSYATTSFSAAAPPWISLANDCSMPIGRSDSRIRSR